MPLAHSFRRYGMDCTRRTFMGAGTAGLLTAAAHAHAQPRVRREPPLPAQPLPLLRPERLRRGDLVAVIQPSSTPGRAGDTAGIARALAILGLRARAAGHVGPGESSDEERAHDLLEMFADPDVRAILPVRGGWGCARLLPLLDYALIRAHPKILMG